MLIKTMKCDWLSRKQVRQQTIAQGHSVPSRDRALGATEEGKQRSWETKAKFTSA